LKQLRSRAVLNLCIRIEMATLSLLMQSLKINLSKNNSLNLPYALVTGWYGSNMKLIKLKLKRNSYSRHAK